eukprot:TRINITY_DN10841_c0_g3_i3.p1 TRINITY_DN10841_c0_g3~~TRINITY_DN10841_c0_g3_i3.p1  ORF type:complete len:100 (+),score=14.87 TRINITY_DN10841_c0_g3_i3:410-709(+)
MWKKCTLSSTSFLVLVHGSPTRLFWASQGLRQGDPLSPFLFTLVAEALGGLLSNAKNMGFEAGLGGWGWGARGVITPLQFADDTILFSSKSWDEIVTLK